MGAWKGTGALLLWIDVEPALQREADAWYVDEHLPERVDIGGYRSARRYRALEASPRYLSIFDADTPAALASDGYLRLVRSISDQSRRIRAGFTQVVRNTFEVRASTGRARGGVLASLRLAPAAPDAAGVAAAEAAMKELVGRLARAHGVVGVHWLAAAPSVRARMDSVRAVGQDDRAVAAVLIVEATQPEELRDLRDGPLTAETLRQAGWIEEACGTYALMVEFG